MKTTDQMIEVLEWAMEDIRYLRLERDLLIRKLAAAMEVLQNLSADGVWPLSDIARKAIKQVEEMK